MIHRFLHNFLLLFFIGLNIIAFVPSHVQATTSQEPLEQAAIKQNEKMVLVQYVDDTNAIKFRSMTVDGRVRSCSSINAKMDLVELQDGADVDEYISELKQDPQVRLVEKNHKLQLFSLPNDPLYPKQWALTKIQAPQAWGLLPVDQHEVVVAVIDTGIDIDHPDLVNRIASGGYNFFMKNQDVSDVSGHGTAVAGLIAAETNNTVGIAGISGQAPVKILPLRITDSQGASNRSDVIQAIDYAIAQKVDIINFSMGSNSYSEIENQSIQKAIQSGICVVASAGNDGTLTCYYPASYDGVLSVGSLGSNQRHWLFSNHNDKVDLSAPGSSVYCCNWDGTYVNRSGTSFAAPMVAGVAALLKTADSSLSPARLEAILTSSATDYGVAGKDPYYGYGVVNAYSAMKQVLASPLKKTL